MSDPSKATEPVWGDVESSMIAAFKYHPDSNELDVMFNNTGLYRYMDVPAEVVAGLREASSKGSYIRSMIIDVYPYVKGAR